MFTHREILSLCVLVMTGSVILGCERQPATRATPAVERAADQATETQALSSATDADHPNHDLLPSADAEFALKFTINQIHCEGCAQAIRVAINEIDGVKACKVSLRDQSAVVYVDDRSLAEQIIHAMDEQGRKATLIETTPTSNTDPA